MEKGEGLGRHVGARLGICVPSVSFTNSHHTQGRHMVLLGLP